MKKIKLILISIIHFFVIDTFAQSDLPDCDLNTIVSQDCKISSTHYLYNDQFGSRSLLYQSHYESADNQTTITPELGWHTKSNKITWKSSTLLPINIKKDKKIFGVTGTLDNTVYNTCTLNNLITDTVSLNLNSACYVPSGSHYVYSSFLGGRSNKCSFQAVDSTTFKIVNNADTNNSKGKCWIDTSGVEADGFGIGSGALKTSGNPNFVIKTTAGDTICPQTGAGIGLQTSSCTTPDRTQFNGFFYPTNVTIQVNGQSVSVSGQFGGRSKNCLYASNNQSCWVVNSDDIVQNDTACTEKYPDGTANMANLGTDLNSNSCKMNSTDLSAYYNNVLSTNKGRFIYTSPRGGRNANCSSSNKSGTCYVNSNFISDLDADLIPENIQKGLVLFGVRGTLNLAEIVYGSGAYRTPANVTSNRIAYKQSLTGESNILEAGANLSSSAIYPADYHVVPKINTDTERNVTGVVRTSWGTTECGDSGSITSRVTDCANLIGATAKWQGTIVGTSGQSDWDLVTRKLIDNKYNEVWRDNGTGLLWSSLVTTSSNWCKASGSNGKQITSNGSTGYDPATSAEDDPSNYCDSSANQNQSTPISLCYLDDDNGTGVFKFSTTFNMFTTPGKSGLLSTVPASSGRVYWRLPTIYDYMLANHHGLRFVLPDIGVGSDEEWTATTSASNRKNAWTFSGITGQRQVKQRNNVAAVRCIGR